MATLARAAVIDGVAVREYVARCAAVVRRHAPALTRLDAALGDGDHGDNLVAGFAGVEEALAETETGDVGSLLSTVGYALVRSVGGASGPLYGAAFLEAGFAARRATSFDLAALADLLDAAATGLARRGRCAVGDKTIYDALAPAATALRGAVEAGADDGTALARMVEAARLGMRATRPMVARRGIALRLGERSRGLRDPGAASCFLLIRALVPRRR